MSKRRFHSLLRITLLALLLIEAFSFVMWTDHRLPNLWFGLTDGRVWVCWPRSSPMYGSTGTTATLRHDEFQLWLQFPLWRPRWFTYNLISLPLWPLIALNAAAFLWLRRSLRLPGHCPRCRYNLRDLPPSNGQISCPECGNSSKAPLATRQDRGVT